MANGRSVTEGEHKLLDLVLRDLFGPQTLVRDGILPPQILYRHPGFRLPFCRGPGAADTRMLEFYAADLARAPDGRWWVLADRTESASGAGFALENRIAISGMLPDVSRQCGVERLAPYFIAVKEQLARLAPKHDDEPRIVLLSQAAGSINYFEDAFLARYLGYPLAEAGDLAVRRNRLYLKSLAELSPVNVLLRRPNSEHLDPLEVGDTSAQGTAGLLQVARTGNVAIANSPGTGLIESPIFRSFLPRLCRGCSASRSRCRASRPGGAANQKSWITCSKGSMSWSCGPPIADAANRCFKSAIWPRCRIQN